MKDAAQLTPPSVRLAHWRASLAISQGELAERLGISQTLLSDLERGATRVKKLELAVRIEQLSASWSGGAIRAAEWVDTSGSLPGIVGAGQGR